jgi:hypothetical protein
MDQTERAELRGRMRTARSAIELLYSPAAVSAAKMTNDLLYTTRPGESVEQKQAAEDAFRRAVLALRAEVNPERNPNKGRSQSAAPGSTT